MLPPSLLMSGQMQRVLVFGNLASHRSRDVLHDGISLLPALDRTEWHFWFELFFTWHWVGLQSTQSWLWSLSKCLWRKRIWLRQSNWNVKSKRTNKEPNLNLVSNYTSTSSGSAVYVLSSLTWCCKELCHHGKSAAAYYRSWPHGNLLPSHLRRTDQVSRSSPAWKDPGPGSHPGIRCTPTEGRSTLAVETHWVCSPVEELRVVYGKHTTSRDGFFC